MDLSERVPHGVDVTKPSAARIYDYFLGGAHNFAVDRALADQITTMTPNVGQTMRAGRAFLRRAVRFLVGAGIRQFLDIGSGIPTVGNVHEIAQQAAPESKVIYVDVDPIAVAHSQAILEGNDRAAVIQADLREPEGILAEARQAGLIDFSRPTAILLAGVVHFVPDADDPASHVATLRNTLTPGGYLVLSHTTMDDQPPEVVQAQQLSQRTGTEIALRSRAQVEAYFEGLTLVEPGLVFLPAWRPDPGDVVDHPEQVAAYGGVGRKD
jgi:SAM-dependent methyltransferase